MTPKEGREALERVWKALSIYLNLPNNPGVEIAAQSQDIRVQRLASMVQHYSSQLTLARAEAQAHQIALRGQEREIQLLERESEGQRLAIADQRRHIEQQARMLDSVNVFVESLRSISKGAEVVDKEEFLGGIVALGTYEEKGVSINWAEAFRALRRVVSGEKAEDDA